ncbi:MAG: pyrroline-5-carboxylate reductase [Anaerotignaceae bacterium]
MKYGFIGAGNMAGAIIKGMVNNGVAGADINVFAPSKNNTSTLKDQCGVVVSNSQKELIDHSDVIILAIKPQVIDRVSASISADIGDKKPLVISLALGKSIEFLEGIFSTETPISRVMPNINAKIAMSTSGYCINKAVTPQLENIIRQMFEAIGTLTKIEESMFSIFSALAGSSPAFAYLYMDAMARAAQKAGMPKKQALEIISSTVLGSAKMVMDSNEHPCSLMDQVCSPGGSTIEGIASLENNKFQATLTQGFDAIIAKDKLIQQKK